MTPAQKIRQGLYAKAHIAKKALGIDDETWKAIIERLTQGRADSCAGCTIAELEALVLELTRKGFRPAPPREKADDFIEINPDDPAAQHLKKLIACWFDLMRVGAVQTKSAKRSLRKFIKKLTGVDDLRWLTPQQCNSVIEACKGWKKKFLLKHPIAENARPAGAIPAGAIVKAASFDALRRIGEAGTPIEGIRNLMALLDSQNFTDTQIAAQVAGLVREFGERACTAMLRWDFKKVRLELLWLVGRVAEVDRTIAEGMRAALKADEGDETPGAMRGPRNKNSTTRGDL